MKRRILALVLALVLAFSMIPAVSAASDEAIAAADALYALGLFNGTGTDANGRPIYDLDRAPTRHEAVTMLVRLLGKEAEAQSGQWDIPFTDVANWAKPYVGYAYANGLTNGTSATTFGGGNTVTASQYITFVLRALGYDSATDFRWDAAWELSDTIGLTDGRYSAGTTEFLRGDVAIISNNALSVAYKNSTSKLWDTLKTSDSVVNGTLRNGIQGYWERSYKDGTTTCEEYYFFQGTQYGLVCKSTNFLSRVTTSYEEGSFTVANGKLLFTSAKEYTYDEYNDEGTISETQASSEYSVTLSSDRSSIVLNGNTYQRSADAETYTTLKNDTVENATPISSADYAYLAAADFRSVRNQYSSAVGQCAYVYAFKDDNGNKCVLTEVRYKIRSNYSVLTFHNLSNGSVVTDPANYFQTLADRSYGMTKIYYWGLANDIRGYEIKMLQALKDILSGGNNSFDGVYVSAAELNY